jgi:hypothetical protein
MFLSQKITKLQPVHFQPFLPIYQDSAGWSQCRKIAVKIKLWKTFDKNSQKLFSPAALHSTQIPQKDRDPEV